MTLTIKNSPESNNPGKPGAPSQNSGNTAGQSPRSNPVCLEVGITIRSLPTEANGLTQPIREEGKTVIVFDNGAVLRTSNNLPIGQSVILSNANGRDVVCRVVGGRNLPNVKGYAEVEFLEPVKDFWCIHQGADSAGGGSVAPPLGSVRFSGNRRTATCGDPWCRCSFGRTREARERAVGERSFVRRCPRIVEHAISGCGARVENSVDAARPGEADAGGF